MRIFEQSELDNIARMILSEDKETRNLAAMLLTKKQIFHLSTYTKMILITLFNIGVWVLVDLYVKDYKTCATMIVVFIFFYSIATILDKYDEMKNKKNN